MNDIAESDMIADPNRDRFKLDSIAGQVGKHSRDIERLKRQVEGIDAFLSLTFPLSRTGTSYSADAEELEKRTAKLEALMTTMTQRELEAEHLESDSSALPRGSASDTEATLVKKEVVYDNGTMHLVQLVGDLREEVSEMKKFMNTAKHIFPVAHAHEEDLPELVKDLRKEVFEMKESVSVREQRLEEQAPRRWPQEEPDITMHTEPSREEDVEADRPDELTSVRDTIEEWAHRHVVHDTVWEAAILIGWGVFPIRVSVQLFLATLLNAVLQTTFVMLIAVTFKGSREWLDPVNWERYRYTEAHSMRYVDLRSYESLASRICRMDEATPNHRLVVETIVEVSLYLEPFWVFSHEGEVLTILVCIVWVLQVGKDLQSAVSFLTALFNLPISRTSVLGIRPQDEDRLIVIRSLSQCRLACMCALQGLRVGTGIGLLFYGAWWLTSTCNVVELVPNAVALAFLLDVDELIFQTGLPPEVHESLPRLGPVTKKRPGRKYSLWHFSVQRAILDLFVVCLFIYLFTFEIEPMAHELVKLHEFLCGGQLNFAVGVSEATKQIFVSRTPEHGTALPPEASVVKSLVRSDTLSDVTDVQWVEDFEKMRLLSTMPIQAVVENTFIACEDQVEIPEAAVAAIQRYTSESSDASCEGWKGHCFELSHNYIRLHCPVTCGATSPRSGQIFDFELHGVNRQMCRETDLYRSALAEIPCRDLNHEELVDLSGWRRSWELWLAYPKGIEMLCLESVANIFLAEGCSAISGAGRAFECLPFTVGSFCSSIPGLPDVVVFCPAACGCTAANPGTGCPPKCKR